MVVDTSAVVTVLTSEPGSERFVMARGKAEKHASRERQMAQRPERADAAAFEYVIYRYSALSQRATGLVLRNIEVLKAGK